MYNIIKWQDNDNKKDYNLQVLQTNEAFPCICRDIVNVIMCQRKIP